MPSLVWGEGMNQIRDKDEVAQVFFEGSDRYGF